MDIQQLKLLAGRIRDLLQQSQYSVGHNQSLDLSAALPGLRNWPEVQAFPDRVAACELDMASASRLAFRLKKKFELDLAPQSLLQLLVPAGAENRVPALQIWPGGASSGVYITESQDAINALLELYEEATDGALVYAEQAGNHWPGSIDLGESGLWSAGLDRVPSGTLLVVGPLRLDQQSWDGSAERLDMACLHAQVSGHRVAVLVETPVSETIFEDVRLLVLGRTDGDESAKALLGSVSENGELQGRKPFAQSWPKPACSPTVATVDAIPVAARNHLKAVLAERSSGILMFGSSKIEEHWAFELVAASLALTEHVGPAARIMPRHRGTPEKDWQVPEAIKQIPFLPSVQSAYEQGYRRIIFDPFCTRSELLLEYSSDTLFIAGMYGNDVMDIFMGMMRGTGFGVMDEILARTIAIFGVMAFPTSDGHESANDLFLMNGIDPIHSNEFEVIEGFLKANRVLKWEDDIGRLLDSQRISVKELKEAMPRNHGLANLLASIGRRKKRATKAG